MAPFKEFFLGKPERTQEFSSLRPESQQLLQSLISQLSGPLSSGLGNLDQLLSGRPEAFEAFKRPAMREFQEEIIPQLAEGFGGLGATSSSGAQQTFARAGERLEEKLAAQRAGLQSQGLNQLIQLLSQGFPQSQRQVIRPETQGFLGTLAQGAGGFLANLPFLF